jgi:hypothetical protein
VVTRLDRDPKATPGKVGKTEGMDISFHGIKGQLWTRGDWNNLPL